MDNNIKTQWQKRIDFFRFIYSCLMNNNTPEVGMKEAKNTFLLDENFLKCADYFFKEQKNIIANIQFNISENWEWGRIKMVVKSILIASYCEFIVLKTDKKVVIDQAIINTKKYSDEKDYKFVNFVLDKTLVYEKQ